MRPLIALCSLALALNVAAVWAADHTTDSLDVVQERLASAKAILIDVREPSEWAEGHLKSARLLSLSRLRKGVPAAELHQTLGKDRIIYAHCLAGQRCLEAADRLKQAGYEVRALKPGYKALLSAGFEKATP